MVPISPALAAALRAHAGDADTPGEYAFATSTGRPLSQRNVARSLRAAQLRACSEDGTPTFPALHEPTKPERGTVPGLHAFRHTVASRLLDQGASPTEVRRRLGHANETVTLTVYAHEIESADNRALDRTRSEVAFGGVFVETPVETSAAVRAPSAAVPPGHDPA